MKIPHLTQRELTVDREAHEICDLSQQNSQHIELKPMDIERILEPVASWVFFGSSRSIWRVNRQAFPAY